jgi:hypothetical protein
MKPYSRINPTLFKQQPGEQPIRLIKAAQATKLFGNLGNIGTGPATTAHTHPAGEPHKKPEIRMIHSCADYCDLEVVCGCGSSTTVRCWNNAVDQQKAAA